MPFAAFATLDIRAGKTFIGRRKQADRLARRPALIRKAPERRRHERCYDYLNRGTVGTVMRGGGIGVIREALSIPLGSTDIFLNALLRAAFSRPPPKCPETAMPPPRANEATGVTKTTNNATAAFTGILM